MLLYSDKETRSLERNGDWVACVEYILGKWNADKEKVSLFLKLAVTTWYILTFDGSVFSLTESEREFLGKSLCETYHYFSYTLEQNQTCQLFFGYMMAVRTDLFLNSGLEYIAIEERGKVLIEKASKSGNLFAQLLFATDNYPKKTIARFREKVKEHIFEYFDDSQEVDQYFIEIFTTPLA